MGHSPQVLVLSSIDWNTAWQRHQIFAAQFAAAGYEVFFVENTGFRHPGLADVPRLWSRIAHIANPGSTGGANPIPRGVHVVSPQVAPPTTASLRKLNAAVLLPRLAAHLGKLGLRPGALAVVYVPTATTIELVERLKPSLVVYDCASNFRGHPKAPADLPAFERRLLDLSGLVVCDSDFLYKQKRAEHPRVVQIHQGVSPDFFGAKPADPAFQRFCYYGTWGHDMDSRPLRALASAGFQVTFSGFLKAPSGSLPPGVCRLTPAPRDALVERLQDFDAFLLPYLVTPFMRGVIPAKIYEMLAMGRPVIASPLPSLESLSDLIYVSKTEHEWLRLARELPRLETDALRLGRVAAAREHTHGREFARLLSAIDAVRQR